MHAAALLGRDFTTHPKIKIKLDGLNLRILENQVANIEDNLITEIYQIMQIDVANERSRLSDELDINVDIDIEVANEIREIFDPIYLNSFETDKVEPDFEMTIKLVNQQAIFSGPRRLAFSEKKELQKILDILIKKKILRPSNAEYASPVILIKKKNGKIRLCIDYREINKITIRDNFPMQLIDNNIDQLKDKKYFTILDLKDGFHHIKMSEDSVKCTSFVTPMGQFEYLRMPFGLTNAPRVFQRYVLTIFDALIRGNKILLYLDDILIATRDLDKHLEVLREVFDLAGRHHLRFQLDKCHFVIRQRLIILGIK